MIIDDLKEIDDFQIYKKFIKNFILQNSDLQKIIYYPVKNPLLMDDLENPYDIFEDSSATNGDGTGVHGVVLFRRKCDEILNASLPIILIDFNSTRLGNSIFLDNLYIVVRVLMKGEQVQELENGLSRSHVISELFDNEFNGAKVSNVGTIRRISYDEVSLNEENIGYSIVYKTQNLSSHLLDNKNYLKKNYGVDSRENI